MIEGDIADHPGEHDLPVGERRQRRRAGEAEGIGQQQVAEHRHAAERTHQQRVVQRWRPPVEDHQHAQGHAADQAGQVVAGHRMVGSGQAPRDQLIDRERQRRAQRSSAAGVNNADPGRTMISTPSRPNPTAIHWLGLIRSPSSAEATVTSTGVRKITAVASASGMKCRPLMNSRLTLTGLNPRSSCGGAAGAKHALPHARHEQRRHQHRLRHVAGPDDQKDGVDLRRCLANPSWLASSRPDSSISRTP